MRPRSTNKDIQIMPSMIIQKHEFDVPAAVLAPYEPGQSITLDEGHSKALKDAILANLRNTFSRHVKKALNGSTELSDAKFGELQTKLSATAQNFKFGVKQPRGPRADPLQSTMVKLAKDDINRSYKARHGHLPTKEQVAPVVEMLLTNKRDDYVKRARIILRERERVSEEDLLAGIDI
jgi:hypothetical protein